MRASRQEQTGNAGQHEVAAAFERLGWGPALNPNHDLGTDMFLQVRDERLVDLGIVVGAQVKSGPTAFRHPERDETQQIVGWWFRDDDRRHIDSWLRHTVAHLIVLHDLDERISYWAHVTPESVVSTGEGAKLLVPIGNVVDEANREALLQAAGARRPGVAWEGSIWMAGADILPRDRLRHALITPRLVAPHPNAGIEAPVNPEQAIAMLILGRLSSLDRQAKEHADVPDLRAVPEGSAWSWHFAAALRVWVLRSALDPLLRIVADAPNAEARTAATVAAAAGLIELGRIDDALTLLDTELARDKAEAVDHAWLLAQRARARAEVGRLTEAQDDALRAQGVRGSGPDDATASAIAASAAILLFNTSSWGERDVHEMITSADTVASWWRAQTTNNALWTVLERSFEDWCRSAGTSYADGDPGHNKLMAAALMASHACDQSSWRSLSAGIATNDLLGFDRHTDPGDVADALTVMRRAGNHRSLERAVRRVVADGPAVAATRAAAEVDLDASTRTTGLSDLTLLEHAGDVLDTTTATRTARWLLASLDDPSAFAQQTSPTYFVVDQLVDTLAGVIGSADNAAQRTTIDRLLDMSAVEGQIDASSWARVIHALPSGAWTADDAPRARLAAGRHESRLRLALLGLAHSLGDEEARTALLGETRRGSVDALGALGDLTALPGDAVAIQITALAEETASQIAAAKNGIHGFGHDVARTLAILNALHTDAAQWEPLFDLLEHDAVLGAQKKGALSVLAGHADRLPIAVRHRLRAIATTLASSDRDAQNDFGDPYAVIREATVLATALGAFDDSETARHLILLLGGSTVERVRALVLIDRRSELLAEHVGILVALTLDAHPDVRAWSAALLAKHVNSGEHGTLATEALLAAAEDAGTSVPEAIASTLDDPQTPITQTLRRQLRDHRSASVRSLAIQTI